MKPDTEVMVQMFDGTNYFAAQGKVVSNAKGLLQVRVTQPGVPPQTLSFHASEVIMGHPRGTRTV